MTNRNICMAVMLVVVWHGSLLSFGINLPEIGNLKPVRTCLDNPGVVGAGTIVLAGLSAALCYKKNNNVRSFVDKHLENLFERALENDFICEQIIVPTLTKWYQLTDDGITKRDMAYGTMLILASGAGLYGLKKAYDSDACKAIIDSGKNMGSQFFGSIGTGYNWLNQDKRRLLFIALGAFGTYGLLALYKAYKAQESYSHRALQEFYRNLSDKQRIKIFNSHELLRIVGQADDNPSILLTNQEFIKLLTPIQKSHLEQIINNYFRHIAYVQATGNVAIVK